VPVLFYYGSVMSKVEEQLEEIHVGDTTFFVNSEKVIVKVHRNEEWVWENGLRVRKAKGNMRDVKLPPPLELDRDIVDYLLEDRNAPDIVDEMIEARRKQKQ
jgi:hypothetical protein